MKIVVCVKQVPDTTQVSFDKETGSLIRQGVPSVMNPDDKSALELALRLKDVNPEVEITLLSMGPAQAEAVLIEGLCMGADKAVLLSGREFAGADTLATSTALAAAIKSIGFDLVICGRQAIDGDTAQVGPQIAEHLGVGHVSYVGQMSLENNTIKAQRHFEDGYQEVTLQLPGLITAISEEVSPRYMNASRMVTVFDDADIQVYGVDNLDVDLKALGLQGSPTRVKKTVPKGSKSQGENVGDNLELGLEKLLGMIDQVHGM